MYSCDAGDQIYYTATKLGDNVPFTFPQTVRQQITTFSITWTTVLVGNPSQIRQSFLSHSQILCIQDTRFSPPASGGTLAIVSGHRWGLI